LYLCSSFRRIYRARTEQAIWNEVTERATAGLEDVLKDRTGGKSSLEFANWESYLDERWKSSSETAVAAIAIGDKDDANLPVQGLLHDVERQVSFACLLILTRIYLLIPD
jgi:hypothetical protein